MLKYNSIIFLLLAVTFIISCSEESKPAFDTNNFTSIFDNNKFDSAYYPIDIKQTPDGGFLVLAKKRLDGEFSGVYILKANKNGDFESQNNVSTALVNPVGQLMQRGELFYFFCMEANSKGTELVSIDANSNIVSNTSIGISYPCASSSDGDNFILLGYNHVDKLSVIATVNTLGAIQGSHNFGVGVGGEEQVEEAVINHFFQFGRKLPFFVGRVPGGLYYFNGFYDYTFSLVFTDLSSEDPNGLIQGQHENGGFSAALPLGGNKFAASVFNFGDNYILPNKSLQISSSPDIAINLGGFTLPELVANANLKIIKVTVGTKNALVFAGDTKSKQIGLWFYDETSGNLLSSRYFGYSNPFETGNIIQTSDGGLAICGTTYLAGRFPRIAIFKISSEELTKQMN